MVRFWSDIGQRLFAFVRPLVDRSARCSRLFAPLSPSVYELWNVSVRWQFRWGGAQASLAIAAADGRLL